MKESQQWKDTQPGRTADMCPCAGNTTCGSYRRQHYLWITPPRRGHPLLQPNGTTELLEFLLVQGIQVQFYSQVLVIVSPSARSYKSKESTSNYTTLRYFHVVSNSLFPKYPTIQHYSLRYWQSL